MSQEPGEHEELELARQVLAKAIEISGIPDVTEEVRSNLVTLAANNGRENAQKIITRADGTENKPLTEVPLLAKFETDEGTGLHLRYFTYEGKLAAEVFYDPMTEVMQLLSSSRDWVKFYHENVQQLSAEDYDKAVFTNAYDMTAFMLLKIHRRLQLATEHMVNEVIHVGMAESEKLVKRAWRAQGRTVDDRRVINLSRLLDDEAAEIERLMFEWSRAGNEGKWSPQMRAFLLDNYNEVLAAAQGGRSDFKKIIGKPDTGWVTEVKKKYPKLDDESVRDLAVYKSNSDIALDYAVRFAKKVYNINQSAEHIRGEVLRLARKEAKEKN